MALASGTRLGIYEILGPLGKGGMGEVYRARDPKLERDVAIKVLPPAFSSNSERLARFQREAKVLAALNHPNIATIYTLDDLPDGKALVMEYVEGTTIKGPLPFEQAMKLAIQIADALEAAHDKGITHRDIKPGNIMVTPAGVVKVLDFGLASITRSNTETGEESPTLTLTMTEPGVIIGTAAYMSPEQASGTTIDRHADIWSFGVLLWEMLTGKRLFTGDTVAHVLADVLKTPIDFSQLPADTRAPIRAMLARCLDRDVRKRLHAIGEARVTMEGVLANAEPDATPRVQTARTWAWKIAASVLAIGVASLAAIHFREVSPERPMQRLSMAMPEGSSLHSMALSPDGHYVVFAATVGSKRQLFLRALDSTQAQPMAFTEDATYPFWSPDSRYLAFFAEGKLKKIPVTGGPPQSLCDAPNARGGSWSSAEVIVFSPSNTSAALQKVAAGGGVPIDITKTKGSPRNPTFLPNGQRFLYLAQGAGEQAGIYLSSVEGSENRRILADISAPVFAPPHVGSKVGHILFVRENTLMALPFDPQAAQAVGEVFPVADSVSVTTNTTYVPVSTAANGMLLFVTGGGGLFSSQIGWYDRSGKLLSTVGAPGDVRYPVVSPDEKSISYTRAGSPGFDIWIRDLIRGAEARFTNGPSNNFVSLWAPKGDRIVFNSNRVGGVLNLFQKASSGSGKDESLLASGNIKIPSQWSRDGKFVVYAESDPKNKWDLWVQPMEGAEKKPIPFLLTEFDELMGQLSPDGHWMAYTSNQSGRREVYVRPFPPGDGQWSVSVAGGQMPRWRGDGKELFFEAADGKMMSVPVKAATGAKPVFEAGAPAVLFDAHIAHLNGLDVPMGYDATADGKRFLIDAVLGGGPGASPMVTVMINWDADHRR